MHDNDNIHHHKSALCVACPTFRIPSVLFETACEVADDPLYSNTGLMFTRPGEELSGASGVVCVSVRVRACVHVHVHVHVCVCVCVELLTRTRLR